MALVDTILPGYPQPIGAKIEAVVDHVGPSSYNATTGDVYPASNLNQSGFDKVEAGSSLDSLYSVRAAYTSNPGVGGAVIKVALFWTFATTGGVASVTSSGGSGMTAGTYALSFSGGGGSGAAGTIVVATGSVTSITITNPGSGYTSAPTVSAATGGTPPTLTANLSTAGLAVATGANLSGSAVRLHCIGY